MLIWNAIHPRANIDHLGFLVEFLDDADPRPAREQFHTNYAHGGGWHSMLGFTIGADNCLCYPGDPPLPVLFETTLRNETIRVYPHSWVVITQPDGRFEVARMD